jgi:putative DNA primase/helicase
MSGVPVTEEDFCPVCGWTLGSDMHHEVCGVSPATTEDASTNRGTINASDIHPVRIEWLWEARIPLGMLTVFTGAPKVGKSTILYDLAARVSRDGKHVLVATAEDHLAAVVRPRLEAAGADLDLVDMVTDPITFPDDVSRLSEWVEKFGSVMVMLDPLVAFIGDGVNTHRDHHVRRVLAPLADVAEATGAAVVVVVHTNKALGGDPLTRVSGSIGFTGAARSIVVAADDPQDDSRKIFAVAGTNLAEAAPALAYRVMGVELADEIRTSRIEWLGEAPEIDVRELLDRQDPEERSQREEAIDFLRTSGAMDSAQPVKELESEARARGISDKTLQRARRSLRLPVSRPSFGGPYYWGPLVDSHAGHPTLVQQSTMDVTSGNGNANPHAGQPVHLGETEALELLKTELGAVPAVKP